jgi:anti-anti-sigma factor
MQIQETTEGDVLILRPEGHLDTAAAIPAEKQVLQLIEDGALKVLIDCSDLEYVNSSGLKVFLLAAKRLDTLNGKFAVCSLAPNVKMIFEMIGFTKILTIVEDCAAAKEYFQAGSAKT